MKTRFLRVLLLFAIVIIAPPALSQTDIFRPAELRRQAAQLFVKHGYGEAIREMKRFLVLEPEHQRAREAQDQIYKWESLAR